MPLASFIAVRPLLLLLFHLISVYLRFYLLSSDLKPENLLFRTAQEDADIMLADFGLSRIMEEEKLNMLTEICGTPGVSGKLLCQKTLFSLFSPC